MPPPLDILVVSQFFAPEMGAPAARFHDFGKLLIERGHRITVLTGFPNSPSGVVPAAYRGRLAMTETIDGITVLRGWLFASPKLSKLTKAAGFASFAASASLQALVRRVAPDVVVATSPPPTVGVPGMLLSRRLGVPLVFDVRDIWPEAIAASGRLQSGALIRALERLERAIYAASSAVTVVTDGKRERLVEKGVPAEKVHVIPNGVDLRRFEDQQPLPESAWRALGLEPGRFTLMYAGIMNPPQGLDVLLGAAAELRAAAPDLAARFQLAMVGAGSERARLAARVADEGLGDVVRFVAEQPRDAIPPLLRSADAIAVTLRPRKDTHTVPSKLYEAMASGRPVLVSADGAPAEILREAKAGLATPASDAAGLAQSIRALLEDPERARAFGAQGRAYASGFDRGRLVEKFEAVLAGVVGRRNPGRGPSVVG
ncbi:MAG: glycosyltransferase WbuB [Proteobacteria bacterium]|nr:MAG: glycosyltransferase WbuB [Pseudomonadota bacterium]